MLSGWDDGGKPRQTVLQTFEIPAPFFRHTILLIISDHARSMGGLGARDQLAIEAEKKIREMVAPEFESQTSQHH